MEKEEYKYNNELFVDKGYFNELNFKINIAFICIQHRLIQFIKLHYNEENL
jgi:hypothetical protein